MLSHICKLCALLLGFFGCVIALGHPMTPENILLLANSGILFSVSVYSLHYCKETDEPGPYL